MLLKCGEGSTLWSTILNLYIFRKKPTSGFKVSHKCTIAFHKCLGLKLKSNLVKRLRLLIPGLRICPHFISKLENISILHMQPTTTKSIKKADF